MFRSPRPLPPKKGNQQAGHPNDVQAAARDTSNRVASTRLEGPTLPIESSNVSHQMCDLSEPCSSVGFVRLTFRRHEQAQALSKLTVMEEQSFDPATRQVNQLEGM